jgi:hypothetical protein
MSDTTQANSTTKTILRYMALTYLDEGYQTNEECFRSFITLDEALQYVRDYQSKSKYGIARIGEMYEDGTFSRFRYSWDFEPEPEPEHESVTRHEKNH